MDEDGNFAANVKSVRQLPKGQMQSIRKMWESKGEGQNQSDTPSNTPKSGLPVDIKVDKPKLTTGIKADGNKPNKPQLTKPRPLTTLNPTNNVPPERRRPSGDITANNLRPRPVINRKQRAKSDVPETASAVAKALINLHNRSNEVGNGQESPKPRERSPVSVMRARIRPTTPQSALSGDRDNEEDKTDLVSRRTKLFESPKPDVGIKPSEKTNVTLRPKPTARPRSRPSSECEPDAHKSEPADPHAYDPPWDVGKSVLPVNIAPPPPKKPPRTGAHEQYMQGKLLKIPDTEPSTKTSYDDDVIMRKNILYESIDDIEEENKIDKPAPIYKRIEKQEPTAKPRTHRKNPSISSEEGDSAVKKPVRPPPPRPRPISVAVDNLSSHPIEMKAKNTNGKMSNSRNNSSSSQNAFYEDINEKRRDLDLDNIKHWDLTPVKKTSMRRSMSAECIAGMDDLKMDDPVYVDPITFRDDTNYEIYVDSGGYAVPYRHQRLDQTKSWDMAGSPGSRPLSSALKSKFGGLKKKFFSPDGPNTKSKAVEQTETAKSAKKKLQNVKTKINLAFTVIRVMKKSEAEENQGDDPNAETTSNESDSLVDVKEIEKRKEHCHLVRRNTVKSIRVRKKFDGHIYPQMFDYGMVVGLEPKEDVPGYTPKILYKFPELTHIRVDYEGRLGEGSSQVDSNVSVPQFCFPDAEEFDAKSASPAAPSESYSFVLTNLGGERIYGYCRRLVPLETPAGLPEVICIISPIDAFNMYNELLDEIQDRRQHSLYLAQELIAASFGRPMPSPGKVVQIKSLDEHGEVGNLFLKRPEDARINNVHQESLLARLGVDKLLKIFSCILLERSVLFCAKSLSTLTQTICSLTSLLYPFRWQHVYIPVLPEKMLEVCCSPTPYLIGILSSHLQKVQDLPLSDIVIFDLNKKQMLKSSGDEGTLLPKSVQKALKTVLNMCKLDADSKNAQNLMISEAFMRFFVEAIGHYADHITIQQDGQKVFVKEGFVQDAPTDSFQQFLEWFTETQMFEVFITSQVEKTKQTKTIEMFNNRIMECRMEEEKYRKNNASCKAAKKIKKMLKKEGV